MISMSNLDLPMYVYVWNMNADDVDPTSITLLDFAGPVHCKIIYSKLEARGSVLSHRRPLCCSPVTLPSHIAMQPSASIAQHTLLVMSGGCTPVEVWEFSFFLVVKTLDPFCRWLTILPDAPKEHFRHSDFSCLHFSTCWPNTSREL